MQFRARHLFSFLLPLTVGVIACKGNEPGTTTTTSGEQPAAPADTAGGPTAAPPANAPPDNATPAPESAAPGNATPPAAAPTHPHAATHPTHAGSANTGSETNATGSETNASPETNATPETNANPASPPVRVIIVAPRIIPPTNPDVAGVGNPVQGPEIARLAMARCQHEERCGNIGTGKIFPDGPTCMSALRGQGVSEMYRRQCPGNIDAQRLSTCMSEIGTAACGADPMSQSAACSAASICPAMNQP